jgi:hypothetical protein
MSALGQEQTSRGRAPMSALPLKADIARQPRDVRFVPKADILRCGKRCRYSITSSAFRTPEPLVNLAEMGLVRAQSARNLHRRV